MLAFHCSKCQANLDIDDVFCRKCGTPLVQEAQYTELPAEAAQPQIDSREEVKVIEVTALSTSEPASELAPAPKNQLLAFTSKVGSKVAEALKSEQGKKITRGATALAVAVGVELLSQATSKNTQTPATRHNQKKLSPSVNMADSLLRTMEEQLATPPENADIDEVYIRERLYIRRIIRKR